MREELYARVKSLYEKGDPTAMFRTILSIARVRPQGGDAAAFGEIGHASLSDMLECLERCVMEKRLSWLAKNERVCSRTGDPLRDGFHLFYEAYLGLVVPRDGRIISAGGGRLVTRWWNRCPTLDACIATGLDTREVCRKAYERPVQVFLARVDSRLKFRRNYDALRPHLPYCEELIEM
jgi:hypothetical protein